MRTPLRILIVEDSEDDAQLILRVLRQADYELTYLLVQDPESITHALTNSTWDVVVSDFAMPSLDGRAVLRIVQDSQQDIPFIILSGAIGEELAVSLIKAGAHDCVSKDNLPRLVPVIQREVKQSVIRQAHRQEQAALKRSDERFRAIIESSPVPLLVSDANGIITYLNPKFTQIFGYSHSDIPTLDDWWPSAYPDTSYRKWVVNARKEAQQRAEHTQADIPALEVDIVCKNGVRRTALATPAHAGDADFVFLFDISERKRAEEELQQKNTDMEHFTHMVSHDLKSPLITISTFLEFLKTDLLECNAARIEQDFSLIAKAADKMQQLLLELEQIARSNHNCKLPETMQWKDIVGEALNITAGSIAQRGVHTHVDHTDLTLWGDRPRFVRIWQNLIDNAVKFMGEQAAPQIHIGVEQNGKQPVFFVSDNGQGIDLDYHAKIFELFEKIDERSPGTGLGLAMVKKLVEQHHGDIAVTSEGAGRGVKFRFTLPDAIFKIPQEA